MDTSEHNYQQSIPLPESDQQWTRRRFFKTMVLAGIATQSSFLPSCNLIHKDAHPLSNSQFESLQRVLEILFPEDESGPGALQWHADQYILWVLNDPRMDPEENDFLVEGLHRLHASARDKYEKDFTSLEADHQHILISELVAENWGERWLSLLLTFVLEAMVSDPVYGFNELEIGWKWLNHVPGIPRPDERLKYDAIFETIKINS